MKKQNGITLIALIITIIVMLILIGVTINVVINGGLFDTTKITVTKEEGELISEQIVDMFRLDDNGKIQISKMLEKIVERFGEENVLPNKVGEGASRITIAIKGKNGTYNYIISREKIKLVGNDSPILPEGLEEGSEFEMDAYGDENPEKWIVLYKNEDNIEVISKDVLGEKVTLGSVHGKTMEAINSYNNAIATLNEYCNDIIKIDNIGVRSVGTNPECYTYENENKPLKISLSGWKTAGKSLWNKYGVLAEIGEEEETYIKTDYNQMKTLGIETAKNEEGNGTSYWMGSRIIYNSVGTSLTRISLEVASVSHAGVFDQAYVLWTMTDRGSSDAKAISLNVRPIIKLQYPQTDI